MADRIFPNTFQEEPLDSDLVFKGIDWDNFNTKLAEVQSGLHTAELPEEFREVLAGKNDDGKIPEEVLEKWKSKKPKSKGNIADLPGDEDSGLEGYVRKKKKNHDDDDDDADSKDTKKNEDHDKDHDSKKNEDHDSKKKVKAKECTCGSKPCTCGYSMHGKDIKKASTVVFSHPSQLSAEAVEAAIASGDQKLANTILAARHERRVKLASEIETRIAAENDKNRRLAKRKEYRESLVAKVASQERTVKTASTTKKSDGFVKVSSLDSQSKRAFASKAIAEGFPKEYVDAILGNEVVVADNTAEIRKVMASDLSSSIKKSAVSSMVKTATLTNADYTRLIKYWKEELGYGDQEWIDALFTKKYD